jgi:hypothetical protein
MRTSCLNVFVMALRMSMTIRAVNDRQLRKMTKALGARAVLFEVTDVTVFRRYNTPLSAKGGIKFRRQVAVAQSV